MFWLDNSVMSELYVAVASAPHSCLLLSPDAALPPHSQIVKSPPPEWEASYKAWLQLHQLQHRQLKQYPLLDAKQRDAAGSKVSWSTLKPFPGIAHSQNLAVYIAVCFLSSPYAPGLHSSSLRAN